jgi:hypothetical protein
VLTCIDPASYFGRDVSMGLTCRSNRGSRNSYIIVVGYMIVRSRGRSFSIVSDYGLDDRVTGVRSPAEAKNFSSNLCVHTGSGAHPTTYTMGTGGPFLGSKVRPGRDGDHSPHLVTSS